MQTLQLSTNDVEILKHICQPTSWVYGNGQWALQYYDHSAADSVFLINALRKVCDLSPTNSETHIIDGRYEILKTKTNPFNFKKSGVAVLTDVKYVINLDEIYNKKTLQTQALTFFAKNPEQLQVAKNSNVPAEVKNYLCSIF
jgi:hypothetical protein